MTHAEMYFFLASAGVGCSESMSKQGTVLRYGSSFEWPDHRWSIHDCETPEEAQRRLADALSLDRMGGKMSLWHWLRFGRQLRRVGKALEQRRPVRVEGLSEWQSAVKVFSDFDNAMTQSLTIMGTRNEALE